MKKVALALVICMLGVLVVSSLGMAASSESLPTDYNSLYVAIDLEGTGLGDTFNIDAADSDYYATLEELNFHAWLSETFPDRAWYIHYLPLSNAPANDDVPNLTHPAGEAEEGVVADVFLLAYDPAYVTPSIHGNVSVSGMVMVGYNEDSDHPEEAKAVAEYFAERFGILPTAAAAE